ncbi:MAG: hypothetical protein ABFE13_00275 [Phycisphaerales bacterium]
MRIGRKQLAGSVRTALLVSACLALVAMTSGLLLTVHLLIAGHSSDHDSHDCSICQQFAVVSKKIATAPAAESVHASGVFLTDVPESTEYVETRYPRTSPPRGPPCSYPSQSV